MRIVRNLAMLSTILLMAGCAEEPTYRGYRTYGYTETPKGGEVISTTRYNQEAADRSLEASLREQLNRYGDLATCAPNIQITANSGVVTLNGTVPSEREHQMVNACVRNSGGVVSVNDQVRVGYAPTGTYERTTTIYEPAPSAPAVTVTPAPPPVVTTERVETTTQSPRYAQTITPEVIATTDRDNDLAQRVTDSIRADPVLPTLSPNVTLHVSVGRVVVRGIVENHRQKQAIMDAVRRTPGVVEIRDELKVR